MKFTCWFEMELRRKWVKVWMTLVLLFVCAGCSPVPSAYTVEYYEAHPQQRKEKMAECMNDPGALRNDPLCINARQADFSSGIGSLRRLPPMGLVEAEEKAQRERKAQQSH